MWVSNIHLRNIKSFADSGTIALSKGINVLLGANNVGKSIPIKALFMLQEGTAIRPTDLRVGQNTGEIIIDLEAILEGSYVFTNIKKDSIGDSSSGKIDIKIGYADNDINNPQIQGTVEMGGAQKLSFSGAGGIISYVEPNNFIYPFLSKRKAVGYAEQVNKANANMVAATLNNIVSKIDRIANPQHPGFEAYKNACEGILGFFVSSFPSASGKQAGIVVSNFDSIPLEAMGEGVANLVGIIVDLCLAENKLFLIEELENDIHPQALKRLLELIIQKSQTNQFVISTHSNIVTRYLGSAPENKLYYVTLEFQDRPPTSRCVEVGNSPDERRRVLEDLGYELVDYDLAKGWLFLEESSAEKIIREYLIPWFAPGLQGNIRTIAAQGNTDVEPRFNDFNRLFLFLHLEGIYKNRAWVIVDGDQKGQKIIDDLKQKYTPSGWKEEHFQTFSKEDFEEYYPADFQLEVTRVLQKPDGQHKRTEKKELLYKVLAYIKEDEQKAREAFEQSAREVIDLLQSIERVLCSV